MATTNKIDSVKIKAIEEKGAKVMITPLKAGRVDLENLMIQLGEMNIDSILLEGGSTLNFGALEQGIVDKVIAFISPKIIGGDQAKTPVGGKGIENMGDAVALGNINVSRFHEDIMIEGYLRKDE